MQALGRLAEAEAAFARAIALHPAYAEAYCARANLRRAQGQTEAAAANFRTAIEQNPRLAIAWCGLGNLQAEQHRADEAIAAYLRAIELNPRLAEAHDNLGSLYAELGRTDDALAAARQLIRLFPARAEYWQRFADRLRGVRVAEPDGPLMAEIQRCLGVPGIDVEPLVPAALSLLAIAAPFAALLSATAEPAGDNEAGVLTPAAMTLLQHPLLLALLPRAPLVDLGFERLLTRARQTLLSLLISGGPDATGKPTLFALAAALAQQ